MQRIVLLGRGGQIGWELERALPRLGELVALGRQDVDLMDQRRLREVVDAHAPDLLVNAAAFTDVEGAEAREAEAFAINADALRVLAEVARRRGAVLLHYSTDYVFDGTKGAPYVESDAPAPLNAYGRSKLAGEQALRESGCAHLIVRTSWIYAARGRNFVRTILQHAAQRPELRVVDDQWGAPTSARLVAQATASMLQRLATREDSRARVVAGTTVHLTARGETTWYGLARQLREYASQSGIPFRAELVPIAAAAYPAKARRPANSRLSTERLENEWGIVPPPWRDGLRQCVAELSRAMPVAW